MGILGVALDAVGTLITPHPPVAVVYAEAARRQGVELGTELVKTRFNRHFGDDEIDELRGPLATDEATESRRWRRIVAGVLPEIPDPERAFAELWDHFASPDSWVVYEDVAPALDSLAEEGLKVRIASNFDARLRQVLSGLRRLEEHCETVVISSEVGYRKPHRNFYKVICRHLDLPPENVLYVGDDLENDVLGPHREGLHAVLIDRDGMGDSGRPYLRGLTELTTRLPARIAP